MAELITGAGFGELFRSFQRRARRLEGRRRYNEPSEQAALARFLGGQAKDPAYTAARSGWLQGTIQAAARDGRRFERVRVVDDPLTDYQRFGLRNCRDNAAAGEDMRYLDRARAIQLDLPDHDFWLFDDERLALLWFTPDGRLLGAQVTQETALIRQHAHWLDVAQKEATPYADYLAEDPARELPPHPPGGGT